jgi:acyl-CoA synthetase (AMP-forming)/AMP-acid ligase II
MTCSYGQLEADSERVARGLLQAGVAPGDRVVLFMPNCAELVLAYLGCFKAGAIAVPLNTRYRWPEARYAIEHSGSTTLLAHSAVIGQLDVPALDGLGIVRCYLAGAGEPAHTFRAFRELLTSAGTGVRLPALRAEQLALILYTSGSTARPKGVAHTHGGIQHTLRECAAVRRLTGADTTLISLSVSHASALWSQLLPTIATGGCSVLLAAFSAETMQTMPAMIAEHRVTWIQMMPAQLGELTEQVIAAAGRYDLSSLRCAYVGGDKAPLATLERFRETLGFEATECCGMSECGTYTTNPPFGPKRPGSIGTPMPGAQVRIDGAARPGDQGEILLRSPGMMQGYWKDPEATARALRGGWLHTGDLGWMDEDGYLWYTGRSKFVIVRGGSNISPLEVEEALNAHPGVQQSAAIGVPDHKLGQRVAAYAVTRQGQGPPPSSEELRSFVAGRLAAYKVPEVIVLLPSLPTTGMGKIDRTALQRRAESDMRAMGRYSGTIGMRGCERWSWDIT